MHFSSTRGTVETTSASKAIINGLAPDGGLYIPCEFPALGNFIGLSYEQIASKILQLYLDDFSADEIDEYVNKAYCSNLPVKINGNFLELFHGRTLAFKDVALQIFPYLLTCSLKKNNIAKTAVILTATSGDTGSAVLAGMADVPGVKALVFYPSGGVSNIQRLQMTTQEGANLHVFGINGNFDEAQTAIKEVFNDKNFLAKFSDKFLFTSANSINIGRLLPQVAYYFFSYSEAIRAGKLKEGDKINFLVPTGNFGNILAGYYAKKMGLPVNKLICASNSNCVLHDFIQTGVYDKMRKFNTTVSPSMDILISSNLERFIYDIGGSDLVNTAYSSLASTGKFSVDKDMSDFDSDFATDSETIATIKKLYESENYLIDPHTAVAQCVYEKYKARSSDDTFTMILSTASPYKFPETVEKALGKLPAGEPASIAGLEAKAVLHSTETNDIKGTIGAVLI